MDNQRSYLRFAITAAGIGWFGALAGSSSAADLRINSVTIADANGNPTTARVGEPFWVRVNYRYDDPTCDNYVIRFDLEGDVKESTSGNFGCGFSGPTFWWQYWGTWSVCEERTYQVVVTLDPYDGVAETDESNNVRVFEFTAEPALDDRFVYRLGAQTFYDNGYRGEGTIVGVLDRGWIDTTGCGMDDPSKVTEFIRFQGAGDPGLDTPTGHETLVASAAVVDRDDYSQGMAHKAEAWTAGIFTHSAYPWITSPNPPFYGLMRFGRFGVDGAFPDVLNNSWNFNHDGALTFDGSKHVTYAADAVARDGAIVVVAANNLTRRPEPPADGWNIITVGATSPINGEYTKVADFSNRGPSPSFFDLAAGDTRSTIDILAPGDGTPWGGGTSLATPYVSGGVALMVQKGKDRGYSLDPRVIKAVLLNSAKPLANWTNNASLVGDTWTTAQPLDFEEGAGQMALDNAYDQYDAPAQQGDIERIGWDLGTVAEGAPADYQFRAELEGGTPFVATLTWFMDRDVLGYDPNAADPFAGSTLVDQSFDNLDLELWSTDVDGIPVTKVAESVSLNDSVEHIRFSVPQTGTYMLRVVWTSERFDNVADLNETTFGLAWASTFVNLCEPTDAAVQTLAEAQNRYLTITPQNAGKLTALRVTLDELYAPDPPEAGAPDFSAFNGTVRWVGPPTEFPEGASGTPTFFAAQLQCEPHFADWSAFGEISVYGDAILPSSRYTVQAVDQTCAGVLDLAESYSAGLPMTTATWGDVTAPFNPPTTFSQPDINDVLLIVDKFLGAYPPLKSSAQLFGNVVDPTEKPDIDDILLCVDAFLGLTYPFDGPSNCP